MYEYRSLREVDRAKAEPLNARRDLDSYILAVKKLGEEGAEGAEGIANSSGVPAR